MPFLKPSFVSWPSELKQSEIRPFTLRLSNQGKDRFFQPDFSLNSGATSISCISVALSHPDCFSFPSQSQKACNHLFDCLENLDVDEEEKMRLQLSAFVIPLEFPLEPSKFVDVPMWVRGNVMTTGTAEFCFVFYYTPYDPQSDQKYRTQRACTLHLSLSKLTILVVKVDIEPSIEVKTILTASQITPNNYWLALEVENLSSSPVKIPSILALSRHWEVKGAEESEEQPERSGSKSVHVYSDGTEGKGWIVPPQQVIRLFLRVYPKTTSGEESVSVLTNSRSKLVSLRKYYQQLAAGDWEIPEDLDWRAQWCPGKPHVESDVPIFSFLLREREMGALHERKIKLKNLITPPLATYIDGGCDHTEQDKQKKAEEHRNILNTQHLVHLLVNWCIAATHSGYEEQAVPSTSFGQFHIREISVSSSTLEIDEKKAPVSKRRNSLVTLMEAQDELKLETSPLMFTVQSDQKIIGHDFDSG